MTTTQVSATTTTPSALQRACAGRRGRVRHDMAAGAGMDRHAQPCARRSAASSASNSASDRCGLPIATASMASASGRRRSRRRASATIASRDVDHRFGGAAAERGCGVGRFRRDAGDVEQADRAGRSGRRAERLQRVLARMAGDAGDDADRIADLAAVEAAEDRPGDAPSRGRTAAVRPTSKTSVARRFSGRCRP